ncbi:glycine/betaine ABC transporter permease, partial [Streptomyces sp. NPDC059802]
MSTTVTTAAAETGMPPARVPLSDALARHRTAIIGGVALVALLLGVVLLGGGSWPARFAVDLSRALGDASAWIRESRGSNPLLRSFYGHSG